MVVRRLRVVRLRVQVPTRQALLLLRVVQLRPWERLRPVRLLRAVLLPRPRRLRLLLVWVLRLLVERVWVRVCCVLRMRRVLCVVVLLFVVLLQPHLKL